LKVFVIALLELRVAHRNNVRGRTLIDRHLIPLLLLLITSSSSAYCLNIYHFDLPGQALHTSLNHVAARANLQLFYKHALLEGLLSPPLEGNFSVQEAIVLLLKNTGLSFDHISSNTVIIKSPDNKGVTESDLHLKGPKQNKEIDDRFSKMRIEELIVTARKRPEEIQSVPLAVTSMTHKQIEYTFSRDISGIEAAAPNVIIERGSSNTSSLSIRGISLSDLEKSFDPAVGVMIDGVYLGSTSAGLVPTANTERVEILRGPQGILQGKNTTGGLIKIIRAKPTGKTGLKSSVILGSNDAVDISATFDTSLVNDTVATKLNYYRKSGGGYIRNTITGKTEGDSDFNSYGISVLWNPWSNTEALYSYTKDMDKSDSTAFINSSPDDSVLCLLYRACDSDDSDPRTYSSTLKHPAKFEVDLHILRLNWQWGDHLLTSITGYRNLDEEIIVDFDGTPINFFLSSRPATDITMSQELRLTSDPSLFFDYIAGIFLWDREYTMHQTTSQLFEGSFYEHGGTQSTLQQQQIESWASFFQIEMHLTPSLSLFLGARFTEEKKSSYTQFYYTDADGSLVNSDRYDRVVIGKVLREFSANDSWTQLTPKIGFSYVFNDDAMMYSSYTEGFRSGGFNGRARSREALGPYDPETVRTIELGLKSDWPRLGLRFNSTLFHSRYEDKQEEFATFIGTSPLTVIQNASEATLEGAELELQYVNERFEMMANYGYLHAQYKDYTVTENIQGVPTLIDKTDKQLLLAPQNTFAFSARYTLPFCIDERNMGDLIFAVSAKYRDSYQTSGDGPNHGIVEPYTLVDASINYHSNLSNLSNQSNQPNQWKLSLFGKNLNDEEYRPFTKNVTIESSRVSLWSFSTINPPRTWGLQVSVSF
jgi:iron complex outermembrane recepter protein